MALFPVNNLGLSIADGCKRQRPPTPWVPRRTDQLPKGTEIQSAGSKPVDADGWFVRTGVRLPPPPNCRSVFATIVQNRTTFLLFAVYKQVTQIQNLRNLIIALIIHDSQTPFFYNSRLCKKLSFREEFHYSEKCLNVPRRISLFLVRFQSICLYLLYLFNGHAYSSVRVSNYIFRFDEFQADGNM